jgi:hypothetical protein
MGYTISSMGGAEIRVCEHLWIGSSVMSASCGTCGRAYWPLARVQPHLRWPRMDVLLDRLGFSLMGGLVGIVATAILGG